MRIALRFAAEDYAFSTGDVLVSGRGLSQCTFTKTCLAKTSPSPASSRSQRRLKPHRDVVFGSISAEIRCLRHVCSTPDNSSTVEKVTIDPQDLQAAQELDLNHGA